SHRIAFDEPTYDATMFENREFDAKSFRFVFGSPVTPRSVFEYTPASRQRELVKRDPVLGDYDPSRYTTQRIFATTPDGVRVPISLVYRKGLRRDGTAPCLLYGYGAYGLNVETDYSRIVISLLDRGVVYAVAHVRGGTDMGRKWYDDGKM